MAGDLSEDLDRDADGSAAPRAVELLSRFILVPLLGER
jgi:hypothetical protein